MGAFQFELEVGDPQGGRYETVSALVDSAATSTILPESLLRELGVEAMESRTFVVADIGRYNGLGQTCMKNRRKADCMSCRVRRRQLHATAQSRNSKDIRTRR